MYKRILIATDGSDIARKAVAHGLRLARVTGAKVTVATVTDPWSVLEMAQQAQMGSKHPIDDYETNADKWAEHVFAGAREEAAQFGIACETLHIRDKHPAEGIVATAKDLDCDLIVMGSHGRRGVRRLLLGSQAVDVLAHSPVPVLIYR